MNAQNRNAGFRILIFVYYPLFTWFFHDFATFTRNTWRRNTEKRDVRADMGHPIQELIMTLKSTVVAGFGLAALVLSGCGTPIALSSQGGAVSAKNVAEEARFEAYVTGYSYWDNTPPGSAAIAYPVLRNQAGGTGTYDDPITLAVGHRIDGARRSTDYPVGTRFYLQDLRKYAIVEDVCGDGPTPQNGPCHTGKNGRPWIDIYVDGSNSPRSASDNCMRRLTRFQQVIQNPAPDYPVVAGALTESGCQVFSG